MPLEIRERTDREPGRLPLELLATAGIWFWFALGFPFANHNESYDWVVWLERLDFRGALSGNLPSVCSLRPLATTAAWLLYRLGGHSIAPVEILNFAFTLAGWIVLSRAMTERRVFALLALVTGGVFFSGYLYLFHLHGIFYGPLLLMLAALVACVRSGPSLRDLRVWLVISLALALLHPFSLVFYLAVALAAPLEIAALRRTAALAWIGFSCALVLLAIRLLVPPSRFSPLSEGPAALITSFRMVEVHPLISAVALLIAAATSWLAWPGRPGRMAALFALALGALALRAHLPVLPLWVLACTLWCAWRGRWMLAALLAATFVLPVASPTGSPTYTVFVLMLCAGVTAMAAGALESRLGFLRPWGAPALVAIAAALAIALRAGLPVPGLASLARPLQAERERTHQLETLIDRVLDSPWREQPVRLYRGASSPVISDNAVDRTHRPPTQEPYLDRFLLHRRGHPAIGADTLLITFGGDRVVGAEALLSVRGAFAGEAVVYRRLKDGQAPSSGSEGTR